MCWRCRRELISCLELGVWKLILLEVFGCVPCLSKYRFRSHAGGKDVALLLGMSCLPQVALQHLDGCEVSDVLQ